MHTQPTPHALTHQVIVNRAILLANPGSSAVPLHLRHIVFRAGGFGPSLLRARRSAPDLDLTDGFVGDSSLSWGEYHSPPCAGNSVAEAGPGYVTKAEASCQVTACWSVTKGYGRQGYPDKGKDEIHFHKGIWLVSHRRTKSFHFGSTAWSNEC